MRNRLLVVNEAEAAVVRRIFDDFVTIGSTTSKVGKPLIKQTMYKLLHNRMFLGEINHRGQSYPGQHQAIVTQSQWDAVHALIATEAPQRKRVARGEAEPLLSELLFTADGEKLVPSYTNKQGKRYCYYTPVLHRRMGAWASKHGSLPADPIEAPVIEQIVVALKAPHITQMVVERMREIRPDLDEPRVVC
nr:recombinase family protein [Verminephrobacter eiseniae]